MRNAALVFFLTACGSSANNVPPTTDTRCTQASDCAGTDTECAHRTCIASICGVGFTAPGTASATQTAGDCEQNVCDGSGKLITAPDNTDAPTDNNPCTDDVCTAGVPQHLASAAGNPCGSNEVCDGNSTCVACLTTADCGGTGVCANEQCVPSLCTDGKQDGTETGIDCGGSCGACPSVVSTTPADGATAVATNATVAITFAAPMSAATLTAQATPGACSGTVQVSTDAFTTCIGLGAATLSANDTVATFVPAPALSDGELYQVSVSTAALDKHGNASPAFQTTTGFLTSALTASGLCAASGCSATLNESGLPDEADYCVVESSSLTVQTGAMSAVVKAQLYESGVTPSGGSWTAQLGYGAVDVNPENQSGWVWTAAAFSTNVGNNDEYQATLTAPAVGTYRYAYRFSPDGENWTYCDANGAGSNSGLEFEVTQLSVLTVTN